MQDVGVVDRLTGPFTVRAWLRQADRPLRLRIEQQGSPMTIGPVQLIVLGFKHPDFHGEIIDAIEQLRKDDTVRVIDSLAVYKDADGNLEAEHLSNLSTEEAIEVGSVIGALIGLGFAGEDGAEAGALVGADAGADGDLGVLTDALSDSDAWDVLADIPADSAAALLLVEHHWAVPLRDAVVRAGGFRISDAFISPLDLVDIGLLEADEAHLHDLVATTAALPA
jgi:uncharacterized membrane protein